jgi:hypothetical protein
MFLYPIAVCDSLKASALPHWKLSGESQGRIYESFIEKLLDSANNDAETAVYQSGAGFGFAGRRLWRASALSQNSELVVKLPGKTMCAMKY